MNVNRGCSEILLECFSGPEGDGFCRLYSHGAAGFRVVPVTAFAILELKRAETEQMNGPVLFDPFPDAVHDSRDASIGEYF